jgi:hypothetical protein
MRMEEKRMQMEGEWTALEGQTIKRAVALDEAPLRLKFPVRANGIPTRRQMFC